MTEQRIIDKARKLAQLQKRAATAGEAAAAARQLSALMQRYRIEAAQLDEEEEFRMGRLLFQHRVLTEWRTDLAVALCRSYGVVAVHEITRLRRAGKRAQVRRGVRLYGTPEDMDSVAFLFTWLSAECDRLCRSECRGRGRAAAQSYREGFVAGVAQQLPSPREAATEEGRGAPSTAALTVIESRPQRALAAFRREHPGKSFRRQSREPRDAAAFLMGAERGSKIHLGQHLPGATTSGETS